MEPLKASVYAAQRFRESITFRGRKSLKLIIHYIEEKYKQNVKYL